MTATFSIILNFIQLVAILVTVASFWISRRNDMADRITRQANLDNSIDRLDKSVAHLDRMMIEQAARQSAELRSQSEQLQNVKMIVELLLQQHRMNHGQQINGGTT